MRAPGEGWIGLDLGSTFVKGALVLASGGRVRIGARVREPTDRHDLFASAGRAVARLCGRDPDLGWPDDPGAGVYASSSAKGGLRIFVAGLVPDLTLKVAAMAACSAGGRITGQAAYRLDGRALRAMEADPPDIVLLTGGTDGGNEACNRENALALARSAFAGDILFAGNACQQEEMRARLAGKRLALTENLMPEIGRLNIEPARRVLRDLFLERIVSARGLDSVAARCAGPIRPTPAAVLDLVARLDGGPGGPGTLWVDLGGATTDVYSAADAFSPESGHVLRGIEEPRLARTVEGDLGLRLCAPAAAGSDPEFFRRRAAGRGLDPARFEAYAASLPGRTDFVPEAGTPEAAFDEWIAERCFRQALLRHAGTVESFASVAGPVLVQRGKDLRGVRRLVCSGGYLGAHPGLEAFVCNALRGAGREAGGAALLPRALTLVADRGAAIPAAAALAAERPGLAVALFVSELGGDPAGGVPAAEKGAHAATP